MKYIFTAFATAALFTTWVIASDDQSEKLPDRSALIQEVAEMRNLTQALAEQIGNLEKRVQHLEAETKARLLKVD